MSEHWNYLILTAANDQQAAAYEFQICQRQELGLLPRAGTVLVVADEGGRRIGSGGSTLQCLMLVVDRERRRNGDHSATPESLLRRLRTLIVHAGGDSRRLPAYSACGKIFTPLPGENDTALGLTLFDRLVPEYLDLPPMPHGSGQVVVASGDALVQFDAASVKFDRAGLTVLGSYTAPMEASRHGVYCPAGDGRVRLYLQKPSVEEQKKQGAIDRYGRSVLDIGVMSFDAATATVLLDAFGGALRDRVMTLGVDIYREICCALGAEASFEQYFATVKASGSRWPVECLRGLFAALHPIPMNIQILGRCGFLHFGSTRQLITSGLALATRDARTPPADTVLSTNNAVTGSGWIGGANCWVEGCRVEAPLTLAGSNVVAGVDLKEPLTLPDGVSLDISSGQGRNRSKVWFIRCYGTRDSFKDSAFFGRPVQEWIQRVGASPAEIWPDSRSAEEPRLWNARLFPAETDASGYRKWLWMFDVESATEEERHAFQVADRYSCAEIALLVDQVDFHNRRAKIRAGEILRSLRSLFNNDSGFSSRDLAAVLCRSEDRARCVSELLEIARESPDAEKGNGVDLFVACRILHSLGDALRILSPGPDALVEDIAPGFSHGPGGNTRAWLESNRIDVDGLTTAAEWAGNLQRLAFRTLNQAIVTHSPRRGERPRNVLLPDETIWGRGPARIEYAGGWTDTPPYTLEHGGDVLNSAINLNGQPPIHCYCRVVKDPVIRLASIDNGRTLEIRDLDELLDYRKPGDSFALAKAALALSGFAPGTVDWPERFALPDILGSFGGGIELTTLVGIPNGSGLGTSSILGAVILAVIRRLMGRPLHHREIFHDVLRLEQALTTGGGWQDQIGGVVGGSKITSTGPGLFPDPRIHFVPDDLVDPKLNGGTTLLYYTGMTRLAKNILQDVVGRYFNRDRAAMDTLRQEHVVARLAADAMSCKDPAAFGRQINAAFELHKQLSGMVSNETIEALLQTVDPHVYGRRLPGAGSGGFLFMVCKSPADAAAVREKLSRKPLNERSRFFEYEVNRAGLEVTTC